MDFLGQHVVHIDFDRGELLLLKSPPSHPGQVIPLHWEPGECPEIYAWVTDEKKVRFEIDTGAVGFVSGHMDILETRPLIRSSDFRVIGSTLKETASGSSSCWLVQGKGLNLGGFRVDRPVFGEAPPEMNSLGTGFWSRFVVTFDFPGRKGLPQQWEELRTAGPLEQYRLVSDPEERGHRCPRRRQR